MIEKAENETPAPADQPQPQPQPQPPAQPPAQPDARRSLPLRALECIVGPLTWRNALSWVGLVVGVLTIWWLLFQPFVIPTDSMYPTLNGDERFFRGDRVFVNKLIYGPRIPFTNRRLFHLAEPKRWDIVVFRPVEENPKHSVLIKRIVGLPGERVQIKDGAVWVNGQPVEPPKKLRSVLHYTRHLEPYLLELMRYTIALAAQSPDSARIPELQGMTEQRLRAMTPDELRGLHDKISVWIRRTASENFEKMYDNPLQYGILPDDEFAVIPPDSYLVCGDNSPNSLDGRFFGWVPNGNILGRASCTWWPLPRRQDFTGFWVTWKGKLLIYGIPVLVVAMELVSYARRRKKHQHQ